MEKVNRVLLLEDDIFTSRMIKAYLEDHGLLVDQSFDLGSAFYKALSNPIDIAIIDINLPSGSSLDVYRKIESIVNCPIIVCTSSLKEGDELLSLDLGVEDFVNKSRGIEVLYRRIKRALNKHSSDERTKINTSEINLGNIHFNVSTHTLQFGDEILKISKQESRVLHYLSLNLNQVIVRDELYYASQGIAYDGASRSLDLLISRLRKKFKTHHIPMNIKTIHGKGYTLTV